MAKVFLSPKSSFQVKSNRKFVVGCKSARVSRFRRNGQRHRRQAQAQEAPRRRRQVSTRYTYPALQTPLLLERQLNERGQNIFAFGELPGSDDAGTLGSCVVRLLTSCAFLALCITAGSCGGCWNACLDPGPVCPSCHDVLPLVMSLGPAPLSHRAKESCLGHSAASPLPEHAHRPLRRPRSAER